MKNCLKGLETFKREHCDKCETNSRKECQIRFLVERVLSYL